MGVVYLAYDPALRRDAALKLVHPDRSGGTARPRLLREALALAKVSHPNVVQIYDVGVEGDQVFLAMEFVPGETLADWLKRDPPGWRAVVRAYVACAHGLHAAHEAGLIHRDFKPRNVLLGRDGRPRVADFGLAGVRGEAPTPAPRTADTFLDASITRTGSKLGTPRYMAPEQHSGLEVEPAADQFALCVALFEALYGVHPFSDAQGAPSAERVTTGSLRPPARLRGPRALRRVVERGLALKPGDRHASMLTLADALTRTAQGQQRRVITSAAVGALALGLGFLALRADVPKQTCRTRTALADDLWDRQTRKALQDTLSLQAPVGFARLESYATAWVDAQAGMCKRGRLGTVSGATLDASMRCLRRHHAAFDATTQALSRAGGEASTFAWRAAAALPPNEHCIDADRLAQSNTQPSGRLVAGQVQLAREQLTRAQASHTAGDLEAAIAALNEAEQAVDQLGFASLSAETALVRGRLSMDIMDWRRAETALADAIDSGLAANEDNLAAEAAARRVFVLAIDGDPGAVDQFVPMATALLARAGSPPPLEALLANNIGVAHIMVGDFQGADTAFARAFAATSTATDIDPVDGSGFLVNIAMRTVDARDRDTQLLQALEMARTGLGPEHPRTLEVEFLRAQSADEPDVALLRLAQICPRLQARAAADWFRAHQCRWLEAELHDDEGASTAVAVALNAALASLAANTDPTQAPEVEAYEALTRAFLDTVQGRPREASDGLRKADLYFDNTPSAPWVDRQRAATTLLIARLPASLHPPDLVPRLQRATTAFEDHAKFARLFPAARRHARALEHLADLDPDQPAEGRSIP